MYLIRNKKTIIIVLIILVSFTIFTGCGLTNADEKSTDLSTKPMSPNGINEFHIYIDPDTGVNYIVYLGYNKAGMTVRYNADGSIMTSPVE